MAENQGLSRGRGLGSSKWKRTRVYQVVEDQGPSGTGRSSSLKNSGWQASEELGCQETRAGNAITWSNVMKSAKLKYLESTTQNIE